MLVQSWLLVSGQYRKKGVVSQELPLLLAPSILLHHIKCITQLSRNADKMYHTASGIPAIRTEYSGLYCAIYYIGNIVSSPPSPHSENHFAIFHWISNSLPNTQTVQLLSPK